MDTYHPQAEFPVLPPEYAPKPELEYSALRAPELPPLPPEFGQRGQAAEPPAQKKHGLRGLLVLPALLLLVFLCLHPLKASGTPEAPAPAQSADAVAARPEGSAVGITPGHAVRDSESVRYSYALYLTDPAAQSWPVVSVYARVSDEGGKTVAPAGDPDIWESSRALFEYSLDASGLEGALTLTLTAVYTEDGQERQTQLTMPVTELPEGAEAPPALSGTLEVTEGSDVDAVFRFVPAPGDTHEYRLRVIRAGQEVHDGDELMGLSLGDEPGAMAVTGSSETGYEVRYSGGSAAASIPEGTQLSLYIVLVDDTDGKEYKLSTNPIDPVELAPAYPTYPLGGGTIVFTVYNDTLSFDVPTVVEVEDDYRTFLAVDSVDEAGFTGYSLPSAYAPDGFTFGGWVVHVNNPMDLGAEENVFDLYNGDPPVDLLVGEDTFVFPVNGEITPADVERVPPTVSEDGTSVRFVNVHAVWIEENPSVPQLYLDDGFGSVTAYGQNSPMYSEGYLYVCSYPIPEHPGLVFDGWYDENGNRVDMLVCYFSFTPMLYNADGSFAGYDWDSAGTVTLTAHWKPE